MQGRNRTGPIQLGEISIAPGEQKTLELPLPTLYSHSPVFLPVHVINGRRPGPVLFICGAIHGDEINGVEIIRRLLKNKLLARMKGALIAIPVVNVYGFVNRSRYLPDRRDLNRSFPGSENGSMASRLAHTFMQEIVMQCSHGIDLHTGTVGRENLPHIRAKVIDSPETAQMAKAFATPVIINAEMRDGSLRQAVTEHQIPTLLYEAGEALRFDEVAIRAGVKGIMRVMRHLGMLAKTRKVKPQPEPLISSSSLWVRAPQSGILRTIVGLGANVLENEVLGWVADPFGQLEEEVLASTSGIIIGKTNLPLVHEGEALFHIAQFEEPDSAAVSVEAFQDEHDPMTGKKMDGEPAII